MNEIQSSLIETERERERESCSIFAGRMTFTLRNIIIDFHSWVISNKERKKETGEQCVGLIKFRASGICVVHMLVWMMMINLNTHVMLL